MSEHPWLGEGACVTLTDRTGGDAVLAAFDPVETLPLDEGWSRAAAGEPVVVVADLEPHGVLALQLNSDAGLRRDVLGRLSASGRAATVSWSVNRVAHLMLAAAGRVVLHADPVTGEVFDADDAAVPAATETVAAMADGPDPVGAALAFAGERLGVRWSAQTLQRFSGCAALPYDRSEPDWADEDEGPDYGLAGVRARLRTLGTAVQLQVARRAARAALEAVELDRQPEIRDALAALDTGAAPPPALARFTRRVAAEAHRATMQEVATGDAPPDTDLLAARDDAVQALDQAFRAATAGRPLPAVLSTLKFALWTVLPGYSPADAEALVDRWLADPHEEDR